MTPSPTYAVTRCSPPPSTLIAERGFNDTRIADVAERVGASPALVIYYFGTKDSLLTEALRWSERSFYAATEEMLRSTDDAARPARDPRRVDAGRRQADRSSPVTGGCGSTCGRRRSATPR